MAPTAHLSPAAMTSTSIVASSPHNVYILHERSVALDSPLNIKSNAPVTIQRVDKLPSDFEGKMVVSSDCTSDETTFIPTVEINGGDVFIEAQSSKGWLESVWFRAIWSTDNCQRKLQITLPVATTAAVTDSATIDNYCGITWMDAYNECHLPCPLGDGDCGSLGEGYTCHQYTTCNARIESGEIDTSNGGGVNETDSIGEFNETATVSTLAAFGSTEASEFTESSEMSTIDATFSIAGTSSPETNSSAVELSTILTTLPSSETNDSTENETDTTELPSIPTGGTNDTETVTSSTDPIIDANETTVTSTTTAFPQTTIATTTDVSTTESTSTSNAPEVATTESATETTPEATKETPVTGGTPSTRPTLPPNYFYYKYPTYSPTMSNPPSTWTYSPSYMPTSDARAHRFIVTLLALVAVMMIFSANVKFAVIAVAAFVSFTLMGALRASSKTKQLISTSTHHCKYHVDILVSVCQTVHIDSPSVRVVTARLDDVTSHGDECARDYNGMISSQSYEAHIEASKTTIHALC